MAVISRAREILHSFWKEEINEEDLFSEFSELEEQYNSEAVWNHLMSKFDPTQITRYQLGIALLVKFRHKPAEQFVENYPS